MTDDLNFIPESERTQLKVQFVDGSPCNDVTEGSVIEDKFVTIGAKKDYELDGPRDHLSPINDSPYFERANDLISKYNETLSNVGETIAPPSLLEEVQIVNTIVKEYYSTEPDFAVKFPYLDERIKQNVLFSPPEIMEFVDDYLMTDSKSFLYVYPKSDYISALNSYYNRGGFYGSVSAAFCSLLQGIFNSAKVYFGMAQEFAKKLLDFIDDIKNFSIKKLIDDAIKNLKDMIKKIFDRFRNMFERLKSALKKIEANSVAVRNKVRKVITEAEEVLSKEKEVEEKAEKSFEDTLKAFSELDVSKIQYALYRLCSMMMEIENDVKGAIMPIQHLHDNYKESFSLIKDRSGYNSAFAVAAGATRYSMDEIPALERRQREIISQQAGSTVDYAPPTVADISGLPTWEEVRTGGTGHSAFILTEVNSGTYNVSSKASRNMGRDSWAKLDGDSLHKLVTFQKTFSERMGRNVKLTINSAYRSEAYNKLVGGEDNSYHMSGKAFDIWASTWNMQRDSELFIRTAVDCGFNGTIKYVNRGFIHIDTRADRYNYINTGRG